MTLFGDFLSHNHRRSHKWYHYFQIYERHFERFRNRHVTLFEIGIGEGGSLQQWKRYLGPFVRIVGIDIEPMCRQIEEEQIHVRIGSQDDVQFLASVVEEFGNPDIVIDDGSHLQSHVNASFGFLYPLVVKNGVYLVEDLHAAYWPDHGGGLRHEASFIEHAKDYVDEIHAEYTGGALSRTKLGDRTTSIHFYDSVVVLEVGEYRGKGHQITGDAELFRMDYSPDGPPSEPSRQADAVAAATQAAQDEIERLNARVQSLETEIAVTRASTSWRITEPLRSMGRLVRR
jgi:23S rRNA U2552 (ribose-2'-O)-methylase RlmE/FtsJ